MSSNPSEPATGVRQTTTQGAGNAMLWISLAISAAVLVWFYGFEYRYGSTRNLSALSWLLSAWNDDLDYEHGLLFPFVIAGLIIYRFKDLKAAVGEGSNWGLVVAFVGVLLYAAAFRTLQPRIAIGGLPFILWGSVLYLWGWRVAKMLTFPLAILGNALRVTSIFVIAEYGDAKWASTTWHDWSGLLLFYPFSLLLLLVIHSVLEGGLPWKQANKRKLSRVVVTRTNEPKSFLTES